LIFAIFAIAADTSISAAATAAFSFVPQKDETEEEDDCRHCFLDTRHFLASFFFLLSASFQPFSFSFDFFAAFF